MNGKERGRSRESVLDYEEISELFLSELRKQKQTFLTMRAHFGLGPEVGLASFVEEHTDSPAFVCSAASICGQLHVAGSDDDGELTYIPIKGKLKHQMVIKVEHKKKQLAIISFGIPRAQYEVFPQRATALFTDPLVFTGMLAHELSHCVVDNMMSIQEQMEVVLSETGTSNNDPAYQAMIDLVACRFGYGNQILAALEAWRQIVLKTRPGFRAKLQEIKFRRDSIKRFLETSK